MAGYLKLHEALQHALLGGNISTIIESTNLAKVNYLFDREVFGPLNHVGFYDMLYETLSSWCDSTDPLFLPAFSWTLLESIADMKQQPPRLKPAREIKFISTNGTDVVRNVNRLQ